VILYLRLAFGTAVVLAPGWALARAIGHRSVSAVLAWSLAALFIAWAIVFAVHASIDLAAALLGVILLAALVAAWRRRPRGVPSRPDGAWAAGALGVALGIALWWTEGAVVGDGLFHEARVRKLVDFGGLHLTTLDEFKDGGLHPGYAFPLWHELLAIVAWISGADPGDVLKHEPSLLAPLACVAAWEAGVAVFESRWAGAAVLAFTLALFCFGPGYGGSFAILAEPGTAARQLLVPAAITLWFTGRRVETALIFGALTLTHSTYALFLLIPLAAWCVLRLREWHGWWQLFAAAVVPAGLVLLWLKPILDETVAQDPGKHEQQRAIAQYRDQLVVTNLHHYRLAPEMIDRAGIVTVAALIVAPVCALAWRRSWAAFALGGTLLVVALMEIPWLFVHFSQAVSLSQSRRAAGFVPFPFALAGAFALLAQSMLVLPLALAAGIALQRAWPGDYELGLHHGGPGWAAWITLFGGTAALALALWRRPREPRQRHGLAAIAAVAFVLPAFAHGAWHWSPRDPTDPQRLPARLADGIRTRIPRGAVLIAPLQLSYEAAAIAPIYIVAAPPTHVANTTKNLPYVRRAAVWQWLRSGDAAIPRRYHASWAYRGGRLYPLPR
jgi:hypothetical protein